MKRMFLFLAACMLFSWNMKAQNASGIELSQDTIILLTTDVPEDTVLIAHVLPHDEPNKQVRWEITEGDGSVISTAIPQKEATTDTMFTFTSVAEGDAIIVARKHPTNETAACVVRVIVATEGIQLDHDTIKMTIDEVTQTSVNALTAAISPSNATGTSVVWENLNEELIEIDTVGNICNIKALARDTAKIVATTFYDYDVNGAKFEVFTDTCVIVIKAEEITAFTLQGIDGETLPDELDLTIGDDYELTVYFEPSIGIDKSVVWLSSDYHIIEFYPPADRAYEPFCKINAKGVGSAEVIAISKQTQDDNPLDDTEWVIDKLKINVLGIPAEELIFEVDTIKMNREATTQLRAIVLPHNTTDKSVEWSIEGPPNIDISATTPVNDTICLIEALWSDTTKIVAKTTLDNGDYFTDTCVVIVYVPVDSVVFKINDISINDTVDIELTDELELKAIVYPDSATLQSITWELRDPTIVDSLYVLDDSICYVSALHVGIAEIYAIVNDWDEQAYKDTCAFKVDFKPITGLALNIPVDLTAPDSVDLFMGEERVFTVTVEPFLATNDSVVWSSNNPSVVQITNLPGTENDTICHIEAVGEGEAKIFVASKTDPTVFFDSCVFTVYAIPVEEVVLPYDTISLYKNHKTNLVASVLPVNATDKLLTWTSTHPAIVEISSIVDDTACEILGKGIGEAKIYAIANDGVTKDSCVVKVKEQYIFLETDTVHVNGGIELFLLFPSNATLSGSFELQLPKGFGLTKEGASKYRTSLADNLKDDYDLAIEYVNDSTYLFAITPNSSFVLPAGKMKIMDIVYTVYDTDLENNSDNFLAGIADVVFTFNGDTPIEEDRVSVVIKTFKDPTGNEMVGDPEMRACFIYNRLVVNTDKAETISVYSLNGTLLFTGNKKEGQASFNVQTPEQVCIVIGSSGWANKVFKN